jgi:hypothetical protein
MDVVDKVDVETEGELDKNRHVITGVEADVDEALAPLRLALGDWTRQLFPAEKAATIEGHGGGALAEDAKRLFVHLRNQASDAERRLSTLRGQSDATIARLASEAEASKTMVQGERAARAAAESDLARRRTDDEATLALRRAEEARLEAAVAAAAAKTDLIVDLRAQIARACASGAPKEPPAGLDAAWPPASAAPSQALPAGSVVAVGGGALPTRSPPAALSSPERKPLPATPPADEEAPASPSSVAERTRMEAAPPKKRSMLGRFFGGGTS